MFEINSLQDIEALAETSTVECKLAGGKDGQGRLPEDFGPTYSAFANKRGGYIILGVREKKRKFYVDGGIPNAAKVRDELFDLLHNPQKVSACVLSDDNVEIRKVDGKKIIVIEVPRANRRQRPVFIDQRPFGGTFTRDSTGDRRVDQETVRRWLAEQSEEGRDARVLPGFGIDDLDPETIRRFRLAMQQRNPTQPFLKLEGSAFLKKIKAFGTDRETRKDGPTAPGLLMFGRHESIVDEFPHYAVDMREFASNEAALGDAYVRRLVPDGTWSGNLFDFYARAYNRLVEDLKVPHVVRGGVRREKDTPVHLAVQEALVNSIIHADFGGRGAVVIAKWPASFLFRNPGTMRVPLETAITGGDSDCRNRLLQQMFFLAGAGDKQGAGIPRIYEGWASQHWTPPAYQEDDDREQTALKLRMVDLIDPEVVRRLQARFGTAYDALSADEKVVLACAESDGDVMHARALELCALHPVDVTRLLQGLTRGGFLERRGYGPASVYQIRGGDEGLPLAVPSLVRGEALPPNEGLGGEALPPEDHAHLAEMAAFIRSRLRVDRRDMEALIAALCRGRFLTRDQLAELTGRKNPHKFRDGYLTPMVGDGRLKLRYPDNPSHSGQAYRTAGT